MYKVNAIVISAFAALTVASWAVLNRPHEEPAWPERIQGFSFSPYRADQDAIAGVHPSLAEIDADLALLSGKTNAIRTYTVNDVIGEIPAMAAKHNINVALGAWLDTRLDHNETEIAALIDIANKNSNIVRIIIGNEAILRGDVSVEKIIEHLNFVRRHVNRPVSTAEPWHVWLKYPELADHVDYLAVHMLPYWEGVPVDTAVEHIVQRINELEIAFPGKPIVITEVGWPSNGRTRENAVATPTHQALFLRRFLDRAAQENYIYYVMEAFDQPWKEQSEGSVGAYWGVYNTERLTKFEFSEPLVRIPEWRILAGMSVLIAIVILGFLFMDSSSLRKRGRSFLAIVAFAATTTAVWAIYDYSQQYFSITSLLIGILLFSAMIGLIAVLFAEAHEWAEAHWIRQHRRPLIVRDAVKTQAKVSIHVPAYNEPPDLLIDTLNALAELDYSDFEVLVIDNNTKDPNTWQPVEQHCQTLGPRFRFFHVDPLNGFKAGALNFALRNTADDASVIAVIDADYIVNKNWLKDLVPQFENQNVSIVQAPQDYSDGNESAFKSMCYAEYRGFFYIGMVTRNERNAIIQHGTMTMIRRSSLENVDGWAEWCITEDAELGLRIFEQGTQALYIPKSYGKGLMPDTFIDYKKQRHRWAYGAVQIMRRHLRILFKVKDNKLSRGQQYHFVAGWAPWLADGLNLLFTLGALAWSTAMMIAPNQVDAPAITFAALPLALFAFKIIKLIHLYRTIVNASIRQTFAAAIAGLALSHIIAIAILQGFISKDKPFYRTPKKARSHSIAEAFYAARDEAIFFILLIAALTGVILTSTTENLDNTFWMIMLVVQSIPYAAAIIVSLLSAFPKIPATLLGGTVKHAQITETN